MENQQPEALALASLLENMVLAFGENRLFSRARAAKELRRLHARVQELEKDRGNAKSLVSKIWNQHPEARDTIEKATGAWLVFGQDVETGGVSAQRVTQGKLYTEQQVRELLADARDAERVDALYKALEVCSAELFAQCAHQGRAMKYVEQARKALAAEQCARAAIAAAKGMK